MLDDWGLSPLSAEHGHDMLEVLEDRHGVRSTIVTSQLPVEKWHHVIGDPTFADAILDRLVHNAYRLELKGDSMRKRRRPSARRYHLGAMNQARVASLRQEIGLRRNR